MTADIKTAQRVLTQEAEALTALSNSIGDEFTKAIDIFHALKSADKKGRLIVAGIGKSGHVARKIAATMASTGTPAYFVHPGEASHGDMGMITQNDAVLMLSNSGENSELSDLIHYTRRYNIPLVAITSNASSTMATHADIALIMPKMPEACPNGLAPTTSTTMMIALGDAIAVALLDRMGLTPEEYKVFHPGGKLGQRLMKITELMVPLADLPLAQETETMQTALLAMTDKNLGAVIIIDENKALKGIITDGDLKRHMDGTLLQKPVTEIMSANPKTISNNVLAVEALNKMTRESGQYLSSLLVMDGDTLIGMIRMQDCLQAGLA
ncbi:MAG: KpsF/GutQ family sugar-phosphate isomerase [Alphaproteobacteria bacterium]